MNHIDLIIRAARRIDAVASFYPDGGVQLSQHGEPIGDFDEAGAVGALLQLVMRYRALTGELDRLIDELAKATGEPDAPGEPDTPEDAPDADEPIPYKPSKWAPGAVEAGEFPKHTGPSGAVYGRSDPVDMAQRNAAARQGSEPATSPGQAAYDSYHGRPGIALTWYELPASLKDHWETASKAAIDAYIDEKSVSRRLTKARTEAYASGVRDMWARCCALLGVAADAGTSADPARRDFFAGIGQAGNLVRAMRVTDEDDELEAMAAAARAGGV